MGMSHLALCTHYVGKNDVALCDTKFFTRQLFRYLGYKTFASIDRAAEALSTIRGIVVATPTSSHAALGQWAIERKIPVFIEKPLTLDVAASGALVRSAVCGNVAAQVGFVNRYVASFQRLRALIEDGHLGGVRSYTASMRGSIMTGPPANDSWQGDFKRGGGCLNEYGPHIIDLCLFIFGPVAGVEKAEATSTYSKYADDRVSAVWTHGDKNPRTVGSLISGQLLIDWADIGKRKSVIEFVVEFEHAKLRVDNSTIEISWHEDGPALSEARDQIDISVQPANVGYYLRGEEFSLELEAFLEMCGYGGQHVDQNIPSNTAAHLPDGLEVDKLIDQIARKAGLK
jgi:scyllo-inositol 2-dehydrogenase (NADP+)